MEKIEWDDSFSVGVSRLDAQHQRIIGMMNLLLGDPEASATSETVSELLNRMSEYAREHFRTEEQLMAEHGYPELSAHKAEHAAFRKKVVDLLCLDSMADRKPVPEEVRQHLKYWWVTHILETDMRYRSFFEERGIR